ncbi:LacI family DNA-binding transcriptional regulator, partial [Xanthomonas fragariae]
MRRPTIKDVAERAKVSLKTVSRVINNEPSVMQATRARVACITDGSL